MPMDGFYWGMQILHEFGSRPLNFILLIIGFALLISTKKGNHLFKTKNLLLWTSLMLLLITLNLFVPIYNDAPSVMGRSPFTEWFLQYLTVIWFFLSIYIWIFWFDKLQVFGTRYKWFIKMLVLTSAINLLIFYYDVITRFVAGGPIEDFLFFLKQKTDWRPSGLSSEPSIFGSWVMMIWPLLFMVDQTRIGSKKLRSLSRMVSILCIISAFLSGARTFIMIFILQGGVYSLILFKRRKLVGFLAIIILLAACITAWQTSILPERFKTVFAASECTDVDCSTMSRLGSALAAVNIFVDHPLAGVGLGQFTSYYGQYVPDWALISEEVQNFITEDISQRVNAFNLFARIGAEMGVFALGLFIIFFIWILLPIYKKTKDHANDRDVSKFYMGCLLSVIGGISWWLTQDLFTYQPGIFSLAMAFYLKTNMSQAPFENSVAQIDFPLTNPILKPVSS
jgi:O-antigen ligase